MPPEIKIGMRVILFIPSAREEDEGKSLALPSIVEKLPDEEYILVQMPTYHGYFYPLPREPLILRFYYDSSPYSVQVHYERQVNSEGFMLAKLKRIGPIIQHQMRESFRLKCLIPVTIMRGEKDTGFLGNTEWDGLAIDLSEGGMLLSTNENLEEGESITVSFDIDGQETLEGRVVRVEEVSKAKYRFRAGLKFEHQKRHQARRIYRYIVRVQVEQMKRD